MRSRLWVVALALLILGGALAFALPSRDSTRQVAIHHVHIGRRPTRHETRATTQARNQRLHRPPISTNYGPKTSCEDLRFKAPPYHATRIRVAGEASCDEAAALVRRTHEHCTYGVCDTAGYRCNGSSVATQVEQADCRKEDSEVTWYSGGGG
jgi:hypothetical protein